MKKISIYFFIISLMSCQVGTKPEIKVALLKDSAALPLLAIAEQRNAKVDWLLSFVSPIEMMSLIMSDQVNAAELDPISLLELQKLKNPSYALFSLRSSHGLFLAKDYPESKLREAVVAVDETGISGILLDLWFGNRTPLHLDAHGSPLRYELLKEGKVAAAMLSGEEFFLAEQDGYVQLKPRDMAENIGLLAYFGTKDEVLFSKMTADYARGISLYNQNPAPYHLLYEASVHQKVVDDRPFIGNIFYDLKFYNSIMLLYKMKAPLSRVSGYEELFWLPEEDSYRAQ